MDGRGACQASTEDSDSGPGRTSNEYMYLPLCDDTSHILHTSITHTDNMNVRANPLNNPHMQQ